MDIIKNVREWMKQADYDWQTASVMLETQRYIYCVFMCHLAIEKALKAAYLKKFEKIPPKVHGLVYLTQKIGIDFPEEIKEFIGYLDEVSVPTRYPEELEKMLKAYDQDRTNEIFKFSTEVLEWLKKNL